MIEIQSSFIAEIVLYSISIIVFLFIIKCIVTGKMDGLNFTLRNDDDFITVLILAILAIIILFAGLHFGGWVTIV